MFAPDPIPALKRELAAALIESLRGWTPTEALNAIGLDPSRLSDMRHGRLCRFSTDKLIQLLTRTGRTVTLHIEQRRP